MSYKIIFDNGKPYEIIVNSEAELRTELKDFYDSHEDKTDYFNAYVYDENDNDITESQFIIEIIGNIINTDDKN